MIPFILAAVGGYLIGDSMKDSGQKFADGGNVKKLEEDLPKQKLLSLLKETKFKRFDNSEIKDIEYDTSTYNPFDVGFVAEISAYPCLIIIKKIGSKYEIKIGEDTGWIGGISFGNWDYIFDIPKLNYEEFEKGLKSAIADKNVVLYSRYNSGSVDKILFIGSIDDVRKFAKSKGYEEKESNKKIYFSRIDKSKKNLPYVLDVGTFTKRQIKMLGGIKELKSQK